MMLLLTIIIQVIPKAPIFVQSFTFQNNSFKRFPWQQQEQRYKYKITSSNRRPMSPSLFSSSSSNEVENDFDQEDEHQKTTPSQILPTSDTTMEITSPTSTSDTMPSTTNGESSKPAEVELNQKRKRRKMELSWCGRDSCLMYEEGLREKVVGEHNEIVFESPATGQVAYQWMDNSHDNTYSDDTESENDATVDSIISGTDDRNGKVGLSRVLIIIKWNDDELLQFAAEAVRKLTSKGDVIVMLPPDMAAKFKHYYGVDNDKIQLFERKGRDSSKNINSNEDGPDLICTFGGDGLLMYASQLFPGPCPPILCVAGGSLGFLTPFSRDEMVDAIRISLGLNLENEDDDKFYYDGQGEGNRWYDYDEFITMPNVPQNIASKIKPSYVDEDGITWTGSYSIPKDEVDDAKKESRIRFGSGSQICMSTRMRLECLVINSEGVVRAKFNVLNEVVIDRGSSPYLAALECFCDNVHLTTVQADGVIFSTPTGSTAYSMAAGGSVVHPAVPAILVTPICPHVLSFRSMVFPDHVVLRCYVPEDARSDASVAFDGKHRRELRRGDSVQIQMSSYPVPTINRVDHSSDWLTSLKRNFNFNTRIRQTPLK